MRGDNPLKDDIRKFEALGTRPFFIEQAIGKAIEFHEMIGAERKEKRLHYLKNYWMEKVKEFARSKTQYFSSSEMGLCDWFGKCRRTKTRENWILF